MQSTAQALQEQAEHALEKAEHTLKSAEHALQTAAEAGEHRLAGARDSVRAQLRHVRARLDDLEDQAMYGGRKALRTADEALHAHPYSAIGIAAAVGLIIGWLAARR